MTYCIVPWALAEKLHEPLRRHFAEADPHVEVVVEQRGRERRSGSDRRVAPLEARSGAAERRRIRSMWGRRVDERRAVAVAVDAPETLPRKAHPHLAELVFAERLEASTQELEDRDTARLVTRIQAGDHDLFGELYVRYFDRVYKYLQIILRDTHEAEDLTQDVFVAVLDALPRYERRSQPFRAWLFVIVRNRAVTRLERRRRQEPVAPDQLYANGGVAEQSVDPLALDWLTDRDLAFLVERLPLPQRQVLVLRYMLDFSYTEIALALDRSIDDVRQLHHRARRHLEERLRRLGHAPRVARDVERCRTFVKQATVLRTRRFGLTRNATLRRLQGR